MQPEIMSLELRRVPLFNFEIFNYDIIAVGSCGKTHDGTPYLLLMIWYGIKRLFFV